MRDGGWPMPPAQRRRVPACGLRRRRRRRPRRRGDPPLVRFLNVATAPPAAIAPYTAQPAAALLDEMHVFDLSTSTMHRRVDAFRKLYGTLGYSFLEFTRFWPFDALSDRAYTFIAANKHRLAPLFPEQRQE